MPNLEVIAQIVFEELCSGIRRQIKLKSELIKINGTQPSCMGPSDSNVIL